ncbi:MAG: glycosyltransferase family 39 protein, partial [bacterium]|nr:glycosyltransferase family 39 protein [bacterium]
WVLPAGYGTARIAAWVAGGVALLVLYGLLRASRVNHWLALAGVAMCGLGRAFYFPWQDSRPDMQCALFGLASLLFLIWGLNGSDRRWIVASGLCVGMAGLSHPYALVMAIQVGLCILVYSNNWSQRILFACLAGVSAILVMALWLPLIMLDREAFESQFMRNVMSRSGPGLISRLTWPWSYFGFQLSMLDERLGRLQLGMVGAVLLTGGVWGTSQLLSIARDRSLERNKPAASLGMLLFLAFSGWYLHVASLGMHPAQGYLCYPWAVTILLLCGLIQRLGLSLSHPQLAPWSGAAIVGVLLLLEVPGSGLRASWTYGLRHREVNYNRQFFCEQLAAKIPEGSRLLVSPEYVFEFELMGRRPVNASLLEIYHSVEGLPFDYLVASTQAFDEKIAERLQCRLLWELGDPDDPLACYVRVYEPTEQTPRNLPWPR